MIVLVPLGGLGERFKKNGYKKPKALINVFGKPILYYLLDNLDLENVDFVYIPYNVEYSLYRLEDMLKKDYPNISFKFCKLHGNTRGASETINIALRELVNIDDKPIICLDGDNFYTTNIIKHWDGKNKVASFIDDNTNGNCYSYVKLENDKIVDIVEKTKISNYACCGAYGFSSYKNLLHYTQKVIDNKITTKGEFYTSLVIREMIKDGIEFRNCLIDQTNWHCLGTPLQLKYFYNNYPKICIHGEQKIKTLRVCFDLDNTLVTFPKIQGDYKSVEPIEKNIKFLRYLKSFGHTIIIYTARRMKTHNGNIGSVMRDIGTITFDTLEKFDIPYDEIYFGKPHADIYIDDLALNCHDDLEKELGYYNDMIIPRDFNEITENVIPIYKKISDDLSGEIYYYRNIPVEIKDMFPLFINYDEGNKWYVMEKVSGLTVTSLYLSELLTVDMLKNIMNSIKRIQSVKIDNYKKVNIYDNYINKLDKRYTTYDYARFSDSKKMYEEIRTQLLDYENKDLGKMSVIHGDTVMTNILINNFGKIKFIDMRGKIDNQLSICGDWLYDWAKLYQSLIGYDEILQDKKISESYKTILINEFTDYFIKMYSVEAFNNLKTITKSLLFTLIPLHDNEKCYKYYELIKLI